MTAYGYHFCTMRLFNLFVFGLLVICSLSGCCEATANPDVPTGMLSKSRDYLFFCLQIIQDSRPLYNQFASRYYYALFSIAKISSIWKHKHFNNEFETHEEVWKMAPVNVRKLYGEQLKSVRTECDYFYDINDGASDLIKKKLQPIVADDKTFNKLIGDVDDSVSKYYKSIGKGYQSHELRCDELLQEIRALRDEIKKQIGNEE